jgi:hypothetical protein
MIRKLISMGSVAIGASLNVDALYVANAVDGVMRAIRGKRIVRVALAMLFGGVLSASAEAQSAQTSTRAYARTKAKVAAEAEVTVSGTIQVFNGQNYLVARLLVVDDETVAVRNEHGFLAHTTAGSRTHHDALAKTNGGAQ